MIDKQNDIIYNNKYLVITSTNDSLLIEGMIYSFKYVVNMNNTIEEIDDIYNFIKKNNFSELIFVDYIGEYYELINKLNGKYKIKFIYTKSLSSLCDETNYLQLNKIIEFYNQKVVCSIAFIDKMLYEVLNDKYDNIFHISLDIPSVNENSERFSDNRIGILSSMFDAKHSTYNEISAVKLLEKNAVVPKLVDLSKSFFNIFDIKYKEVDDYSDLFKNNSVNLYVNFTNSNPLMFIKSLDNNIPCIVGNNCFLNDSLSKLLSVKSDDDINEIKSKIEFVDKNRQEILSEYKKFREEYSVYSKQSIEKFTDTLSQLESNQKYEKEITIVVPVYNTSDYISKCLDSIIAAIVPNSEILVINDGSTDSSENVIKKYIDDYPNLIRYIKQENHGLGNVRNVALKEAKGKYIASVDSDDSINVNFFKEALPYIKKNIDIVIYDWLTVTDDSTFNTPAIEWIFKDKNKYKGLLFTTIMPSTCNKIIKKQLFNELDIKYIEDKYEDLSTNPFIMLRADTIKYIAKPYYEYYIRSSSIMRSSAGYSMIDILKEFDIRLNKYKKFININVDDFKFYTYSWRIEEYIFNQLYDLDEKELEKFINYIYDNLYNLICDVFSMKRYKDVIKNLKNKDFIKYIEDRNNNFKEKKLTKFILKSRKEKKYKKLTPSIIYFGE